MTCFLILLILVDIVFGSLVPGGISEDTSTIDVASLKALGDKTMKAFKLNS